MTIVGQGRADSDVPSPGQAYAGALPSLPSAHGAGRDGEARMGQEDDRGQQVPPGIAALSKGSTFDGVV